MAFNPRTFRTRTITSAVFVVVMLTGLLLDRWSFFILFSVIHFGCWWEYLKLVGKIFKTGFHKYFKLGLLLLGYGVTTLFCGPQYHIAGYDLSQNFSLPITAAGFMLMIIGILQKKGKMDLLSFGLALFGLLYISLSLGLMMNLYRTADIPFRNTHVGVNGDTLPILIIISLWVNDTMAYLVGSFIGKTSLSPVSPKKTWEGTIGGIVLSIITVGLIAYYYSDKSVAAFIFGSVVAAIASISGTFGDLFESKLKRLADVKDSGRIMPGHGGFLDRFDSLLFAVPCCWLFIQLSVK
jgi:phosphatidate cytidylyltransferase